MLRRFLTTHTTTHTASHSLPPPSTAGLVRAASASAEGALPPSCFLSYFWLLPAPAPVIRRPPAHPPHFGSSYAKEKGIPVPVTKKSPWSMDANLMHVSYESGILEDPETHAPTDLWQMTVSPKEAPDKDELLSIEFKHGVPIKVTNKSDGTVKDSALEIYTYLNTVGGRNAVGRIDIVENRFIGMKSRGCYETPAGAIIREAHLDIEALTIDREVRKIRDLLSTQFTSQIYNGLWWSPESTLTRSCIKQTQEHVEGTVEIALYKGNITILGRKSPKSLYDQELVSMDVEGGYDPNNSTGFIKVNALRLRENARLRGTGSLGAPKAEGK